MYQAGAGSAEYPESGESVAVMGCRGERLVDEARRLFDPRGRVLWPVVTAAIALIVFLSTLQVTINGSGRLRY